MPITVTTTQPASPKLLFLGRTDMDETHKEFIDLWIEAFEAGEEEFADSFAALVSHTRDHFAHEEELMLSSAFPITNIHKGEHQRMLEEMAQFSRRLDQGDPEITRAWLKEQVPLWFDQHLRTMDWALAAHLAAVGTQG